MANARRGTAETDPDSSSHFLENISGTHGNASDPPVKIFPHAFPVHSGISGILVRKINAAATVAVAVLALALTGCGKDDDKGDQSSG